MIVKKHRTADGRLVLAICDKNLTGKKIENKKFQLDLTSDFYKGEETSEKEVCELMKRAYIINLVGKKSVGLGLRLKLVAGSRIIKIKNVPHAQVLVG